MSDAREPTDTNHHPQHPASGRRSEQSSRVEIAAAILTTPVGPLTVVTTGEGLLRVSFGNGDGLAAGLATRLGATLVPGSARLDEASAQLGEYFAGQRREFELPLDWRLSGGLPQRVLHTLFAEVGFGRLVTYQELGARAGLSNAARAVGAVMGANAIPVVVPCHRVVAKDGLGGYGGGLEVKRWLLALEGVLPPTLGS